MAETTTTQLASIINAETILEARLAFQKNANIPALVRLGDITGVRTKVASFPVYNTVVVTKPASETTDVTTTSTVTPTDVTLTVARRTIRVDPSDLGLGAWADPVPPNVRLGQIIGAARAKQVDEDILAVMTTTFTSSVGATNSSDVSFANVRSALLTLEANETDTLLQLILHSKQFDHLRGDLVIVSGTADSTDKSSQAQEAMNSGKILNLFGASVLVTNRVGTGSDTNDLYLGLIGYTAEAIAYAIKNVNAELGIAEIELQRDASKATHEFVMNYYDKPGIIRPSGLVLVKSSTY